MFAALVLAAVAVIALPAGTLAEQASQPGFAAAGQLDVSGGADDGSGHTCARLAGGNLRCWGFGGNGRLGYGNTTTIGDDETPGSVGTVGLGSGRTAAAISVGAFHSCALLNDASVRCWGFGGDGRLGYANTKDLGDDETAGAGGPVSLGGGTAAISAGGGHTCALLGGGSVRCWGYGRNGRLGYGSLSNIGDNETPGSVAPVNLGTCRTARAITAGRGHTCAVLDDDSVRCWGFGGDGRLGYGNTDTIGDNETPGSVGPVKLGPDGGPERTAKAISAGAGHTCVVLDDDSVRCWGFGGDGRLGYGNTDSIGDNETPGSVGPVKLGPDGGPERTAKAISAGAGHTCALLDDGSVRCWGFGAFGQLGYGNPSTIGDNETPGSVGPVKLGPDGGPERTAKAISAGREHTCALLDDGSVRCWGFGGNGRLGYGNPRTIGDNETPGSIVPVDLGRPAKAISAGDTHTCALLDDDSVRCWGFAGNGRLGYANTTDIGDTEAPGLAGPVDLGPERKAKAISAGGRHTCALLDDDNFRCWGYAATGRLGYCNANNIGDNETPGSVGPVNVMGAVACRPLPSPPAGGGGPPPTYPPSGPQSAPPEDPFASEAMRARALRSCLRVVSRHARREQRSARRLAGRRRVRAIRHLKRHRSRSRRVCLRRHGRTPGRLTGLEARAVSRRKIVLSFNAPGTDGAKPPAARAYLVKQSRRRIRGARDFRRAQTLCKGRCRFPKTTRVGAKVMLAVTNLRPGTTYYYAVAARDNVSRRLGRRSRAAKARTRR